MLATDLETRILVAEIEAMSGGQEDRSSAVPIGKQAVVM